MILSLSEENDIRICPDFYSKEDLIIGEVYTHLSRLKPEQMYKIEVDILKLLFLEKEQKGVVNTDELGGFRNFTFFTQIKL